MPGPYIHIAVSDKVRESLSGWADWGSGKSTAIVASASLGPGPKPQELADFASKHPSYYALGAIGPDLFFFLPDFRSVCVGKRLPLANTLIGITEWLDGLYEDLDGWILADWEKYFGPGNENTAEAISRMTGDLSTMVADITGGFASIGTTALLALASQSRDWVGQFSLGLNKGYDNQDFFWSDMLHYRRTSGFGQTLWTLANNVEQSDELRAYALGYITHLATDTTGHAFVNEKSGGPFRTHWQRHHLVENHMDAQTYDDKYGGAPRYDMFTESALHYRVAFTGAADSRAQFPNYPLGDSLRDMYVRRRMLDLDSDMPPALASLIFDAMGLTYQTGAAPSLLGASDSSPRIITGGDGRPDAEMIRTAYLLMFRYLKMSTLDGFTHDKPEPPEAFPNLDFPVLTDPHDPPPTAFIAPSNAVIDTDSVKHLVLSIIRLLRWLAAVALWLATILPTLALDAATYVPRLIAYYSVELPLYYMVKAERRIMVMSGFMHPMRDEIDDGLVRLCRGHDDAFLSMVEAMNDTLGGMDDNGLAAINTQALKLLGILAISPAEAMAQALGMANLSSTHPSEPLPDKNYPHAQPLDAPAPDGKPIEYHAPWRYPNSPTELDPTFAGPYTCGDMPQVLLDGGIPGDQTIRNEYETSATPANTDQISFAQATKTVNLGDPVNFSAYLMWQLTRVSLKPNNQTQVTDWNLDADRGYAYKCWDWNRHYVPKQTESRTHVLTDLEGHEYMEPCTPPPQTETHNPKLGPCVQLPPKAHDAKVPLAIHYIGQPDPKCD